MLETQKLAVGYAAETPVLCDVSLTIERGITVIAGVNGSGKSTLLKTFGGLLKPLSGRVSLEGCRLENYSPRVRAQKIASMTQFTPVYSGVTVDELLRLGRFPFGSDWRTPRGAAAIGRAVEMTGAGELIHRFYSTLSGGERQRVRLALALAQEPKILLLDEPVSFLDVRCQLEFIEIVKSLSAAGVGVVMSLHDLDLASRCADRVVLLDGGRVTAEGKPESVLSAENLRRVFGVEFSIFSGRIIPEKAAKQ